VTTPEASVNQQINNLMRAFLQGLTGARLFRRLEYPGAPAEFIDSRSLEEIRASGEIEWTVAFCLNADKIRRSPKESDGKESSGQT